jgi:hypothetical protein
MSLETAQLVLSSPQPRGLKRFVLTVLALNATDGGQLPFREPDQGRIADQLYMDYATRFSRIVEELLGDGYLSLDGGVLTVYAGDQRGAVVTSLQQQTSLLQSEELTEGRGLKGGSPSSQNGKKPSEAPTAEVLSFYDKTFGKGDPHGEDEKREVRAALKIRTVKQCKEAILGNKASAFHQGENDNRKKYNGVSNIFRGKHGKKTRAEVIDYFIDIYKKAVATSGSVKSGADPAIVRTRKEEVRRAHRLAHDQEAQERGRRAVAWLAEQGIRTTFNDDGYPLWPEEGGS